MVSCAPPTSTSAPSAASAAPPFSPMSSSLYGSCASSACASASLISRREKFCPARTISVIFFSRAVRSSGVKGRSGSKS